MQNRTPFLTIRAEGALLPGDLLQRIVENDHDLGGLTPESYHLSGEKLNEAINRSWNRLLGAWAAFRVGMEKLPEGDSGTSVTREKWLLPLFDELDYGRLQITKAIDIEGKSYAISHGWNEVPIHLVGCGAKLDARTSGVAGAAKASPHSLVQELLNRSPERLWGFVSNGLRMRVMRDNASLTRQAYLEFDLEAMMNGEVYADFVVLWLICHQSRVESAEQRAESSWLEKWSKAAQEQGTRALDGLRVGVEKAIEALGKGFIGHPANGLLRSALSSGAVSTLDLYRQLLRLVYRLIFLFVAEDRQLLYDPASDAESRARHARYYSTARLRRMAERVHGSRHADLYVALKLVMDKLGNGGAPELGLPALGGFLFSRSAMTALADCELSNAALLEAVRSLAFSQDGRVRRAVDYKNLGSEELGSIYESLLELHPLVNTDAATFELTAVSGSERKTTGSYYTPSSLIQVLIDSALEPVISEALKRAGASVENQQAAILNLKVVDPACGSGHFLVAAAHRLARRLATVRTGEGEPAPEATRSALRDVISNCIYGVDINPMSVELCKVSLWMEALEPGKPLSFLDAHIQCGNSLVGVSPNLDISEIPDEAFNPTFGDDKATASALKKRNKRERGGSHADKAGQLGFRFEVTHMTSMDDLARWLAERAEQVDAMPEDDSTQVQAKARAFDDYHASIEYLKNRFELDLWTAAFFWMISKADAESMLAPTQQELIQLRNGGELDSRLVDRVKELSERLNFFHWELAFPKVFSGENQGFDCVLGNPPWGKYTIIETKYFETKDENIASTKTKAARDKALSKLAIENPQLYQEWVDDVNKAEGHTKFIQRSGRFPLSSFGEINTYLPFTELAKQLLDLSGRCGLIIKSSIFISDNGVELLSSIVDEKKLVSLFDFRNWEGLFPAIGYHERFTLITFTGFRIADFNPKFAFYCDDTNDLMSKNKMLAITENDLILISPNTGKLPILTSSRDLEILRRVCNKFSALVLEKKNENPWGVSYGSLFHASGASEHFFNKEDLISSNYTLNPDFTFSGNDGKRFVPFYEGKYVQIYDHRFSSFEGIAKDIRFGRKPETHSPTIEQKANPNYFIEPRYWILEDVANERLRFVVGDAGYYCGARRVTNVISNARTVMACIMPLYPANDMIVSLTLDGSNSDRAVRYALFTALLNSIEFDFVARLKVAENLLKGVLFELPIPSPKLLATDKYLEFLLPRILELSFTNWALVGFADDLWHSVSNTLQISLANQREANARFTNDNLMNKRRPDWSLSSPNGFPSTPFIWNEERRYILKTELDAFFAHIYQFDKHDLEYIMSTFPIVKRRDEEKYGEYRLLKATLDAWDRLSDFMKRSAE